MGAGFTPELMLLEPTNSGTDVASGGSCECCGISDGNVTGSETGKLEPVGVKFKTLSTSEGDGKRPGNVGSIDGAMANEDGEERDDDRGDEVVESTGGDDINGIDVCWTPTG